MDLLTDMKALWPSLCGFPARTRKSPGSQALLVSDIKLSEKMGEKPVSFAADTDAPPPAAAPDDGHEAQDFPDVHQGERIPEFLASALVDFCQVKPWQGACEYEFVEHLQEAARNHGCVDLMRRVEDGQFVAVKRMPTKWVTSNYLEFNEKYPLSAEVPWVDIGMVRYLNTIRFPYACEFFGIFEECGITHAVTSFAKGGDVFTWFNQDFHSCAAREAELRPIALQIIAAIRGLHNLGIAHRDISCENILLDDGKVKLIDFGMAGWERYTKHVRGKPSYQAPEMHHGEYDAFIADAFSVGVVLFVMAYQDYPWMSTKPGKCKGFAFVQANGLRPFLAVKKSRRNQSLTLLGLLSDALVDFLEALTCFSAKQRMCLGESVFMDESRPTIIRSHWFLGNVQDPAVEPENVRRCLPRRVVCMPASFPRPR